MQRFLSKYGLAAHLALLAVAPLFLSPFFGEIWVARVLLWLSLFAAVWVWMAPSRRTDELLHKARERVLLSVAGDPLFWVLALGVLFSFLCALNSGVEMAYDAETSVWFLSSPTIAFFPGCVDGKGWLPFATAVAALVLVQGCRHALGRSARISFVFMAASLAGIAAFMMTIAGICGSSDSSFVFEDSAFRDPSFPGVSFGVYFIASLVALVSSLELKWKLSTPWILLAIGGTAVGLFHCAPAFIVLVFCAAALILFLDALLSSCLKVGGEIVPKALVLLVISLLLPVLFIVGFTPSSLSAPRIQAFSDWRFLPTDFESLRTMLSGIADRVWRAYPWRGSGIGSFAMDIRFNAAPSDWAILSLKQTGALNGWWQVLAERGILGTISLVLPILFLAWTWGVRFLGVLLNGAGGKSGHRFLALLSPFVWLGFVVVAVTMACGLIEHSFWRPETLLAVLSLFALAGSSFPMTNQEAVQEKDEVGNGR